MKRANLMQIVVIILLGIGLFFPIFGIVGIKLMWKYLKWPKAVKIIITLPYIIEFLLAIFVIIYLFFFKPYQMKGSSMEPTFKNNAYLITSIVGKSASLKRADMVIFTIPSNNSASYIKRIIGLPNEQININNGQVWVNGNVLNESYLGSPTSLFPGQREGEITVPDNSYYVLGDNRQRSSDSREFGPVLKENITGKVLFCYWNCKGSEISPMIRDVQK